MRVHANCYYSDTLKKPEKYIKQITTGRGLKSFYFVAISTDQKHLEIYNSLQFKQPILRNSDLTVVGVFKSQDECIEYIRLLTDISLQKFNDIDYINSIPFYSYDVSKESN